MSFDMNQCKIGDKLVSRNGTISTYEGASGDVHYPHRVRHANGFVGMRRNDGIASQNGNSANDIVGFYKEENKMIERDKEYDLKVTGEQLA